MNNQLKQDIFTIESKIKSLHQTYLNLKVLEGTHAQKLSSDQQKVDSAFQAAQQNIKNIQRNYQNRIEADKDFLAELTAMVSQLPPKYTKEYKPGFAMCPQSINMNHIRVFYEMVIEDTAESFNNRLWKKNGYYDWKQMTLDFMHMVEEAELYLQRDIQLAVQASNRDVQQAQQAANNARQQGNDNHQMLKQGQKQLFNAEVQKLQRERQAFLSSELVVNFDRRVSSSLVDTGGVKADWSGYNAKRSIAKGITIGSISQEIHAESVSLTDQLEKAIKCFHSMPQLGSAVGEVEYTDDDALPCKDEREKSRRSFDEKGWRSFGLLKKRSNVFGYEDDEDKKEPPKERFAEFYIPYTLPLTKNFRLYYANGGKKSNAAAEEIQSIVLKKLRGYPTDSVRTYFIDPVSRGINLGVLNTSKDKNEEIGIGLYNSKDDIRLALKKLEAHIDDTVSKLGKFSSVKEYNRGNKAPIEETMLVIFDFPESFSQDSLELLNTIIKNSDKCGIDIIISSEYAAHYLSLNDNAPRFDWSIYLKEKWIYITRMGDRFMLSEDGHHYNNYELCTLTDAQRAFIDTYRKIYSDSMKIDNTFSHVFNTPQQTAYKDATNGIILPVMIRNEKKGELCDFVIGANANSTHALITGSTGSGKSSFLHMLITSILLNYHPDDVEFWMIDYGKVEFAQYATNRPASIRFLSTERSEEFTFSFLDYMKAFFEHRADLFAKEGVNDIKAYRAKCGRLSMPRVILMIDEFHIMTQQVQQDIRYKNLLENSLTDYRKYGLSCIFSNQTLSALNGLSDTGKKQIKKRIAMMNSLDEMKLTLDVQNDNYSEEMIHRMERTTTGELWCKEQISDRDFTINQFMAVYIDDKERNAVLNSIVSRSVVPQVDCEVHVINDAKREEISIRDLCSRISSMQSNRITPIHMGVPVTIEREFHFNTESRYNHNVLILGRDLELSQGLVEVLMANIYAQGDAQLLVFADQMDDVYQNLQNNGTFDKYNNIEVLDNTSDICIKINELYNQIKSKKILRQKTFILWLGYPDIFDEFNVSPSKKDVKFAEESVSVQKENTGIDLQKALQDEELIAMAKALDMPLEDLVLSMCQVEESVEIVDKDDYSYNACDDVNTLIQMGGKFNLFTVMVFASHSDIRRLKGFDLNTFIHKIATSMPKEESYEWGLKAFAADLEAKITAVYYDGEKARKFRPYIIT